VDTILIIDDDPDLRVLTRQVLARAGFEVWTESTGQAGINAARLIRPGMLLLDVMLPDRTGLEICREVRDDAQLRDTAVALMSARSNEYDRELGFAAGADDYLVKPFTSDQLLLRVLRVLERRSARPAAT
jgi:two-component system phosphate regulon response regulator PhoB